MLNDNINQFLFNLSRFEMSIYDEAEETTHDATGFRKNLSTLLLDDFADFTPAGLSDALFGLKVEADILTGEDSKTDTIHDLRKIEED